MAIDWSEFDGFPEDTCSCRCGATFRSHAKVTYGPGSKGPITRRPCPQCGRDDDVWSIRSDPETWTIRG